MTRGSDQRIELELALFSLSEPPQQMQPVPVQTAQAAPVRAQTPPAAQPFAAAPVTVQPFVSTPAPQQPAAPVQETPQPAASAEPEKPAQTEELPPLPEEPPVQQAEPLPWDEPAAQAAQPVTPPAPVEPEPTPQPEPAKPAPAETAPANPADPVLTKPRKVAQEGVNSFPYWEQVVQLLQEKDPMLYTYLRKSRAYFDGTRVLIDGGKTFRDFIRQNKDSQRLIKKLIAQVSGVAVPIGPYEPKQTARTASNAEQSLHALEKLGLEVSIEDSARRKK